MVEKRKSKQSVEEVSEKKSKYNNKRVLLTDSGQILKPEHIRRLNGMGIASLTGQTFDSELEAEYYRDVLLPRVLAGEIEVERQPKFTLLHGFEKDGMTYKPITYSPDFLLKYIEDGRVETIDVKGFQNDVFLLKRKLFDAVFPAIKLIILKRVNKYGGWITVEEYAAHKRRERKEYRSISRTQQTQWRIRK